MHFNFTTSGEFHDAVVLFARASLDSPKQPSPPHHHPPPRKPLIDVCAAPVFFFFFFVLATKRRVLKGTLEEFLHLRLLVLVESLGKLHLIGDDEVAPLLVGVVERHTLPDDGLHLARNGDPGALQLHLVAASPNQNARNSIQVKRQLKKITEAKRLYTTHTRWWVWVS